MSMRLNLQSAQQALGEAIRELAAAAAYLEDLEEQGNNPCFPSGEAHRCLAQVESCYRQLDRWQSRM